MPVAHLLPSLSGERLPSTAASFITALALGAIKCHRQPWKIFPGAETVPGLGGKPLRCPRICCSEPVQDRARWLGGASQSLPASPAALLPALPASRLVAGIWIVSLVLLAHSMHSFPSCGMASCRKGQAAAARRAPAPRLALVRLEKRGGRGAASPLAPQSG